MSQGRKKSDDSNRDDRIIALLDKLGERMIRGEQNRRDLEESVGKFDNLFSSLESRAANNEKIYQTIQSKISRAEEIERSLRERQDRIEREQKAQAEKLERAAMLALKMEEALAQQARLARRLEKITQDRARMIHKLERIEEAVVETREALNAKALVLLTDQETAARQSAPQLPAGIDAKEIATAPQWWEKPVLQKTLAAAALAGLLLAGTWAAQSLYREKSGAPAETAPVARQDQAAMNAPQTPVNAPDQTESADAGDDILNMGDEELSKRFNEDPNALAAALNAMEPGDVAAPAGTPESLLEDNGKKPEASTPAPQSSPAVPERKQNKETAVSDDAGIDDFINVQKDSRPLGERIKHDEKLPAVVKEIEQKAFEGVPEAQHDLAAIYTAGHGGVPVDYTKAVQWFREAAINGVANARYNLGVLYQQGMGVEKDMKKAIGWYRAAAKMNHPEAQYNLGIAYIEGIGTDYNPGKAAMHFEQAARSGITEAAYNLGLILENGLLGAPSPREALYWYKKAADAGSPEAKAAMEHLAKAMDINASEIDAIMNEKRPAVPDSSSAAPETEKPAKKDKTQKTSAVSGGKQETLAKAAAQPAREPEPGTGTEISPASPEEIAAAADDRTLVSQVQEQLMRLGLYPGPADGIRSPQTEDAIRAYQKKNGLIKDGQPSQALLVNLLATDLADDGTAQP